MMSSGEFAAALALEARPILEGMGVSFRIQGEALSIDELLDPQCLLPLVCAWIKKTAEDALPGCEWPMHVLADARSREEAIMNVAAAFPPSSAGLPAPWADAPNLLPRPSVDLHAHFLRQAAKARALQAVDGCLLLDESYREYFDLAGGRRLIVWESPAAPFG
jgi:hypothetical protein